MMRRAVGGCAFFLVGLTISCSSDPGVDPTGPDSTCVPKDCAETDECGAYDDGCGETIRCEAKCECDEANFETVCPERPCEVVAGCQDRKCAYAPVPSSGATLECDDTVAGSTFVYVDAQYSSTDPPDGSPERPYTTYAAALAAAKARSADGIVIGGSPVFTEPLEVANGVSVYGGFEGAPSFPPNRAHRPRWSVPAEAIADNRLVGARAVGITKDTVLDNLSITTADVTGHVDGHGASNLGLWVENSPGLSLIDSDVRAGNAAPRAPGANGAPSDAGHDGGRADGRQPGSAGALCDSECKVAAKPADQDTIACGAGGRAEWSDKLHAMGGNPGRPELGGSGGAGGLMGKASGCSSSAPTIGAKSTYGGGAGATGADGRGGKPGTLQSNGTIQHLGAADGAPGGRGEWGAGGGAGGSVFHECMSDPELGGDGGGGGGPGCGGDFGRAGGNGGLSIGIGVVASSGFVIRNSSVTSGDGGSAGAGGDGQNGGSGGGGETDSAKLCPTVADNGAACGGAGQDGGPGGRGGHGGGGAGGSSYALVCVTGTVAREDVQLSAGTAGASGTSQGHAGEAGASGDVLGCD